MQQCSSSSLSCLQAPIIYTVEHATFHALLSNVPVPITQHSGKLAASPSDSLDQLQQVWRTVNSGFIAV